MAIRHTDIAPYNRIGDVTIQGPRLNGRAMPGAVDCLLTRPDGVSEMDGRAVYQADDGALIYVTFRGYVYEREPDVPDRQHNEPSSARTENYFVLSPSFETAAPQYAWLTKVVCFGMGAFIPGGVSFRVYAVN